MVAPKKTKAETGRATAKAAGGDAEKVKKAFPAVTSLALADIITSMSRLLDRLAHYSPLQDVGLGLTEWTALVALSRGGGSNKSLARELGLTKQRVNQITDTLRAAGYLEITKAAGDGRKADITLSEAGRAQLAKIDATLTPVLGKALEGKERAVATLAKSLKGLQKAVTEPRAPELRAKKAGKKAAAATNPVDDIDDDDDE